MRIFILTSCTGEKRYDVEQQLIQADFIKGKEYIQKREMELKEFLLPAAEMYIGQQHVRLMSGVNEYRNQIDKDVIDLWILSAGYGVIFSTRKVAPYECTFQGMKKKELRSWADTLDVPKDFRNAVKKPYDFGLILLGDSYLDACAIDNSVAFGGPTILFCGTHAAKAIPALNNLRVVTLSNKDASRFSCGLIGLKGELAARILKQIAKNKETITSLLNQQQDVLSLLEGPKNETNKKVSSKTCIAKSDIDQVITIPKSWWQKPHRQKLRYFIPEWDDLVDRDYDFETDTHSSGTGDWSNEVYAHQLYSEPNYDGILVSKVVAEKSKKKKERINQMGVHRYLRVPNDFPIMGDCGAFGYIKQETPPYTTDEILDYYTRLGFNYGVSIDHLIVTATETQKKFRYELTIHNAEEFIKEHKKRDLTWEPIGAVQGWDPQSYAKAAKQFVAMGYKYIALGGLVRTTTPGIIQVLEEVHKVVPSDMKIHLFGIARFKAIKDFISLGVTSIDSASVLRKAWLGADLNYLTKDGWYSAIRVPQSTGSFRAKRLVQEGICSTEDLKRLEEICLKGLHQYGVSKGQPSLDLINALVEYDALIAGKRKGTKERIFRTLMDRPWEKCGCDICKKWGIEVAIFRGNNRNRRRGFHNTEVFYELLEKIVAGERINWLDSKDEEEQFEQDSLFEGLKEASI